MMMTTVRGAGSPIDAASLTWVLITEKMPELDLQELHFWVRPSLTWRNEIAHEVITLAHREGITFIDFDEDPTDPWEHFTAEEVMNF